jgi:hypothetical protein
LEPVSGPPLCRRLFDLGLLAGYQRDPDRLVLHDVIRTYLRQTTRRQLPNARPGRIGGRLAGPQRQITSYVDLHVSLVRGQGAATAAPAPARRGSLPGRHPRAIREQPHLLFLSALNSVRRPASASRTYGRCAVALRAILDPDASPRRAQKQAENSKRKITRPRTPGSTG